MSTIFSSIGGFFGDDKKRPVDTSTLEERRRRRAEQEALRKRSEIAAFGSRPTLLGARARDSSVLGQTLLVGRQGS